MIFISSESWLDKYNALKHHGFSEMTFDKAESILPIEKALEILAEPVLPSNQRTDEWVDRRNCASARKDLQTKFLTRKEEEETVIESTNLHGFGQHLSPLQLGKVVASLQGRRSFNGKNMKIKDFIEQKINEGSRVKEISGQRRFVNADKFESFLTEKDCTVTGMNYAQFLGEHHG